MVCENRIVFYSILFLNHTLTILNIAPVKIPTISASNPHPSRPPANDLRRPPSSVDPHGTRRARQRAAPAVAFRGAAATWPCSVRSADSATPSPVGRALDISSPSCGWPTLGAWPRR